MNDKVKQITSDKPVVLITIIGILVVSLFLQQAFNLRQSLLFLLGILLGVTLLHASFGFSGAWRNLIRDRKTDGVRAQLLLLALTSLLFLPLLGNVFPDINATGALAPVSLSIVIGAFLFGIGMQLGGGCGSGTLYTVGGGHIIMLITLAFFIVGATVGSAHLNWWLTAWPNWGEVSFVNLMGWMPTLLIQLLVLTGLLFIVKRMEFRRFGKTKPVFTSINDTFIERLIFGPWPLWWAALSLALLNLLTLLLAGHPWTITFAFGLWGAKIWSALGGDVMAWPYWSSGYPAKAFSSSVLADTTSVMNFGVIIGAVLAAALAGKFAPPGGFKLNRLMSAIIGGLLLGYGARLAFGCNIGALLAGISSGSLHGWIWLVAGFTGSMAGVYLRIMFKLDSKIGAANEKS